MTFKRGRPKVAGTMDDLKGNLRCEGNLRDRRRDTNLAHLQIVGGVLPRDNRRMEPGVRFHT